MSIRFILNTTGYIIVQTRRRSSLLTGARLDLLLEDEGRFPLEVGMTEDEEDTAFTDDEEETALTDEDETSLRVVEDEEEVIL